MRRYGMSEQKLFVSSYSCSLKSVGWSSIPFFGHILFSKGGFAGWDWTRIGYFERRNVIVLSDFCFYVVVQQAHDMFEVLVLFALLIFDIKIKLCQSQATTR